MDLEIENGIYLLLNSSRLLRKLFLESEVNMDKNIVKMIREDRNHILWLNITDIFLMKFGDTIGKEVVKAEMEVGHFYELEESDENIRRRSSCDVYDKVVKILNSIEGGFEGIVLEPGTLILTYRNGDRIKMFTSEYMSITNLIDNISECREFEDCQTADRWFTME